MHGLINPQGLLQPPDSQVPGLGLLEKLKGQQVWEWDTRIWDIQHNQDLHKNYCIHNKHIVFILSYYLIIFSGKICRILRDLPQKIAHLLDDVSPEKH